MIKKKIALLLFFLFLLPSHALAEDKIIGKWVNEISGNIFEIKKNNTKYKMYILYNSSFFREYDNNLYATFKNKKNGFEGEANFILENYGRSSVITKITLEVRDNKLFIYHTGTNNYGNLFNSILILRNISHDMHN